MECISGAKIPPSGEASVCYNSVSQNAITDIEIVILTNTQKIVENFYGIKLGLTHKTYDIKRPVEESYQKRLARQVIFAPKLGQWNYLVKPAN